MKRPKEPWPEATSTVAASIYNLLAFNRISASKQKIQELVFSQAHPHSSIEQIDLALAGLLDRGHIQLDKQGIYSLKDPSFRLVTNRDKSDIAIDETTGEWIGGWNGWEFLDKNAGGFRLGITPLGGRL